MTLGEYLHNLNTDLATREEELRMAISSGQCNTLESYKHQCGLLAGILESKTQVAETLERMNNDDD